MGRIPPAPVLEARTLRVPFNVDSLEEFDYQLTIGMRDNEEKVPPGMDPVVGDRLAHRLRAALPANIRLSA
jgi:hypothetical protein